MGSDRYFWELQKRLRPSSQRVAERLSRVQERLNDERAATVETFENTWHAQSSVQISNVHTGGDLVIHVGASSPVEDQYWRHATRNANSAEQAAVIGANAVREAFIVPTPPQPPLPSVALVGTTPTGLAALEANAKHAKSIAPPPELVNGYSLGMLLFFIATFLLPGLLFKAGALVAVLVYAFLFLRNYKRELFAGTDEKLAKLDALDLKQTEALSAFEKET